MYMYYYILFFILAHGGGWGYNAGSIEAILFSPDQDVLLGGFGLYGGRGQYNVEVKVKVMSCDYHWISSKCTVWDTIGPTN